jgi:ABC-type multidrug transport system ATPase subunit
MPALSVRGLTIAPHGAQGGGLAVEDASFSAQAGAITAILGEAASGKTTLLSGIAGLTKPIRGNVFLAGTELASPRAARKQIGFLPPGTDLGTGRTAGDALRRIAARRSVKDAARTLPDTLIAALGLDGLGPVRLGMATHGQAYAALALARLLPRGDVLLVDEAGEGLTDDVREALMTWLRAQAAGGRTILIATRSRDMALAADHLVLLAGGRVHQAGAPASVHAEPRDALAASMTGAANILGGTLRQKVPGGFVWMQGGRRFVQEDLGHAAPSLGAHISLCLRPALLGVGVPADAPNALPGTITQLICRGPRTEVRFDTALGPMQADILGPPVLRVGMEIMLGWSARDAVILPTATGVEAPA